MHFSIPFAPICSWSQFSLIFSYSRVLLGSLLWENIFLWNTSRINSLSRLSTAQHQPLPDSSVSRISIRLLNSSHASILVSILDDNFSPSILRFILYRENLVIPSLLITPLTLCHIDRPGTLFSRPSIRLVWLILLSVAILPDTIHIHISKLAVDCPLSNFG